MPFSDISFHHYSPYTPTAHIFAQRLLLTGSMLAPTAFPGFKYGHLQFTFNIFGARMGMFAGYCSTSLVYDTVGHTALPHSQVLVQGQVALPCSSHVWLGLLWVLHFFPLVKCNISISFPHIFYQIPFQHLLSQHALPSFPSSLFPFSRTVLLST